MTIEEADSLMESINHEYCTDPDAHTLAGLARGVAIIAKHAPAEYFDFQHDEGFFGFGEAVTDDEVRELNRLGFRINMSTDSWAKLS